eukprot:CAMPEP_0179219614 /NCGR_PEP_ID=MMETSP0797-20121207/5134_1 /TAXON_ID=47934 /ORGANISM="Dinophysis acuminata, Strain DAEP01" /LENGTH=158 /DNA_ID=CAMNT_0020926107 /DNA_START=43 /DNA_END=519 /DNA_ORIENTATION=-
MFVGDWLPESRERIELLVVGPVHHSLAKHFQARFFGILLEECGCHVRARMGVPIPSLDILDSVRDSSKIRMVEKARAPWNEDPSKLFNILADHLSVEMHAGIELVYHRDGFRRDPRKAHPINRDIIDIGRAIFLPSAKSILAVLHGRGVNLSHPDVAS